MSFLISHPTPGLSLGSFTAAHFLCSVTLGFTTKDQTWIRRIASFFIFLLTFIGDRTAYTVSDNASIRCLLVTFSWVQAFNGNSLLCLSRTEYKTLEQERRQTATPKSVFVGDDISGDESFFSRLTWALAMQWNLRRIKTSRPARNTPPFSSKDPSYVPSRGRFLLTRVGVILASIAYMAIIGLQPEPTREDLSGDRVRLFSRLNEVTPYELLQRAISTVTWLSGIGTTSEICYNVIAVVLVGLGLSEPVMWPSWFGSFTEAYSVRRWWGISWHQTWRCFLTDHADWVVYDILHLPKTSTITHHTKNLVVFYLSGLIHLAPDLTIGMPLKESSAVVFFAFQAVGIMIEDLVQSLNNRIRLVKSSIVARCIGYVWLAAWLVWTIPWWSFVCTMHMKAGQDDLISLARDNNAQIL
ncbi:toxin biosynthesis (Tri7) [Fusarium sp. NRRL 52700]|nr:toxin biosynthesis (Tri7) [Fusarium sp. NRRL 52700]